MDIGSIHEMSLSKEPKDRLRAVDLLINNFPSFLDKSSAWQDAWQDLIRLAHDDNSFVQDCAADAIGIAFGQVPDKLSAWQDLIRLAQDDDIGIRKSVADAIGIAFSQVPDKSSAWQNLVGLAHDGDVNVIWNATASIGNVFSQIPDKSSAWQDLHKLSQDADCDVRWNVADVIGGVFSQIPDKSSAWQDLHRLSQDVDNIVRGRTVGTIGGVFSQIPDKSSAWQDLHKLVHDNDSFVRDCVAYAIGDVFSQIPDKSSAWQDLHRLSQDEDNIVRWSAAGALGSVFSQVPDKSSAWQDLYRLSQDEDKLVRCYAYYSLGRASIFRATETVDTDEFKIRLEEAIEYFSSSEDQFAGLNPASFCLPFYRSLHRLLFMDKSKEIEVQRYLTEAKEAVEGSESRELLLEAVENLAKALQEVRSYTMEEIIQQSKGYTRYCFQASKCLDEVKAEAPYASKAVNAIMVKRGIPIIDDKIKTLFKEVEDAAKNYYIGSRGSPNEAFARSTCENIRGLGKVESPIAAEGYFDKLIPLLRANIDRLPMRSQKYLLNLIESMDTATLEERFEMLRNILQAMLLQGETDDQRKEYDIKHKFTITTPQIIPFFKYEFVAEFKSLKGILILWDRICSDPRTFAKIPIPRRKY